ncbi:hypothetical protein G9A89_005639 [Geosiphon pyriformis]|nr:hypothetical protein G9A89_005639 [Geosiphon pyriformis]
MSGFFNTDHKAISVVIGLEELLDAHLNSVHKQANWDHILDHPFYKVVLDHLIADDKLVVESDEMKLKVDEIIKEWTRKRTVLPRMLILWSCQYMSLNYVSNDVFSGVIKEININELLLCVNNLPNDKAAGLSGIFNKLWKHYGDEIVLTNTRPIALIETAWKILSKILSDWISLACSRFNVLHGDNFLVLKSTSTQSPIFAVESVMEDALEKNKKLWLVL